MCTLYHLYIYVQQCGAHVVALQQLLFFKMREIRHNNLLAGAVGMIVVCKVAVRDNCANC